MKRKLAEAHGEAGESDPNTFHKATVWSDYSLDKMYPTQHVFADRVLKWAGFVADVYEEVRCDGRP